MTSYIAYNYYILLSIGNTYVAVDGMCKEITGFSPGVSILLLEVSIITNNIVLITYLLSHNSNLKW